MGTEWSNEFLSADTWLATAESGATGKLYYPPLATELTTSKKITDLLPDAATITTPNNLYGDLSFKSPDKDGTTYLKVPKLSSMTPSQRSGKSMPSMLLQKQAYSTGSLPQLKIQISQQPSHPHLSQLNQSQSQPLSANSPSVLPQPLTKLSTNHGVMVLQLLTRLSQLLKKLSNHLVP